MSRPWAISLSALLLVAVILVLGERSFKSTEQAAFDEFNRRQLALASGSASAVEMYFDSLAGTLRTIARNPDVQRMDEIAIRREVGRALDELRSMGINDVGILDAHGVLRYNAAAPQIEGTDLSWRWYYQQAKTMRSDVTYVTEFIEFRGVHPGEKGVLVAVPMLRTGHGRAAPVEPDPFTGVALCTLTLQTVTERFVAPIKSSDRGSAFLIDGLGTVLWAPGRGQIGMDLLDKTRGLAEFRQVCQRMAAGKSGVEQCRFSGLEPSIGEPTREAEEKLIAYRPIRLGQGSWSLGVWAPTEDARQLIRAAYRTQLTLVGLIIMIVLVGSSGALVVFHRVNKVLQKQVDAQTAELRESHERLITVLDSLDALIFVADLETYAILFANRQVRENFGDVVGHPCWRVMREGQSEPCEDCPGRTTVAEEGQTSGTYGRLRQNPITGRWYEIRGRTIHWAGGGLARLEIAMDLTERKRAEEMMVASQRKMEMITRIGVRAGATLNLEEVLLGVLRGTLEATGASVGMIFLNDPINECLSWGTSIGLSEAFVTDYRETLIRHGEGLTGRIAQSGTPIFLPHEASHDPRVTRPVAREEGLNSFIGVPIYAGGEIVAVMNILTRPPAGLGQEDVSLVAAVGTYVGSAIRDARMFEQLGRAEIALASEKERLAVTLRSIGDGVVTTDTNGAVALINKAAETLTGWTQEESLGRPLEEVFHLVEEKTRRRCDNPAERVLRQRIPASRLIGAVLVARDGTERIVAEQGAPIVDRNGEIIGVVLVFRDITEKRALEEELSKTSTLESIAVLAGGVAHDFNNLLTAILGNISIAHADIVSGKEDHALTSLRGAENASIRARDLTRQLLTFAKGGSPIKKTASIGDLIRDSAGFVLSGSKVRCDFAIAADLWPVDVDEGQISQVVQNLVLNADQAMPSGGVVTIEAGNILVRPEDSMLLEAGRYVKVSVKDQGPGIPEEHRQRIFDPFFTTKQRGSGLGLSVSYSVVKSHGGHIGLESRLGVGTAFHVYLPASEGQVNVKTIEVELGAPPQGNCRVLLMDDEPGVRAALGEMLLLLGYEVVSANDGTEAVDAYRDALSAGRPFCTVILDLTVPGGMGGRETVMELLKVDAAVRAVATSGYSDGPVIADCMDRGFCGFIAKPCTLEELARALHAATAPSRSQL
ncbi:MAG: PAS domain S-box protein [Acidobacteria bacterium]|nr:PAS domain S-box protein [Acidobacteriota bacterium]